MSYTVQSPTFLPISFQETGGDTAPSMGTRIKDFFLGRFSNWKDSILVAGVVFWVVKAAMSFFTGYWMIALVELFTGGFLAMMRKDYRDFTNLHKVTGNLNQENARFTLSNLELRQSIEGFKGEVKKLTTEREKMEVENTKFATSNTTYKKHLNTMERTLDKAIGEIDSASRRGKNVSAKVLKEAQNSFESQKQALKTIEKELLTKKDEALKNWGNLVTQVGKMNANGVATLKQANDQLQAILADIQAAEATKTTLENQITRLKAQVDQIEKAANINLQTAQQANRATSMLNFFFKSDENSMKMLPILGIVFGAGYLAKQYFP